MKKAFVALSVSLLLAVVSFVVLIIISDLESKYRLQHMFPVAGYEPPTHVMLPFSYIESGGDIPLFRFDLLAADVIFWTAVLFFIMRQEKRIRNICFTLVAIVFIFLWGRPIWERLLMLI